MQPPFPGCNSKVRALETSEKAQTTLRTSSPSKVVRPRAASTQGWTQTALGGLPKSFRCPTSSCRQE